MNELGEIPKVEQNIATLDTEVKGFANGLSYWAKYLAEQILSRNAITEIEINTAYSFLLEELTLTPTTNKPDIAINYNGGNLGNYKLDLLFSKLENVEGVNALTENQVIDFSPNLTIIYGANGSGKSGYVRLLKKVFYSKTPEDIVHNIHLASGHKPVSANFTFHSAGSDIPLNYPANSANAEFEQYAVFDNGSVRHHLDHKNEFEFRPAGLSFFADFTEAIKQVEIKLNSEIAIKQTPNDFDVWFDGDSEIKTLVQSLTAQTNIAELNKHTPFSEIDKTDKATIEKKFDELVLAFKNKEKEILKLEGIKKNVSDNKKTIEAINTYFVNAYLASIQTSITDCLEKEATAKADGIENFKTDKIQNIGTAEWKNFIVAADKFAKQQKEDETVYPESNDNCLLCHQPLSEDAENLIKNYWNFIRSVAEQNATQSQKTLDEIKAGFEKLPFDLFPVDNILTVWLTENYPKILASLKENLSAQKTLTSNIIVDITTKTPNKRAEIKTSIADHDTIISAIDESIKVLKENSQDAELTKLQKAKTYLAHKEKFNTHFVKFTTYIQNQQWILKANAISWMSQKRNITEWEKYLSGKYFNQKYIEIFNQECIDLNGNFGIEVSHTGSAGTSFRQLTLKGKNPAAILSEGEQKVIAIADFLAEMQLSEVNKGIIFDDPVTSLDNDRKKQIAERLAFQATLKQVIIFTHDLVFFYHIKNFSKKFLNGINDSFAHHSLERESQLCGKVVANTSPANEGQYHEPTKAESWLAKSKTVNGNERVDCTKAGLSALRTSYEALAIFTILGGTVQRFDPQIRMGRLKDIKYEKSLIFDVVEKHGEISDLIEGHLPSDEFGIIPTPEILEEHINKFKEIKTKLKQQ